MPIYMDRHIVPGITLEDATEAHKLDVAIQDQFDCNAITFWLDEDRGCAFCLIEAPNEEAVRELHNEAHGLIPHEIIEVDESLVMAFLGRINEPQAITQDAGGENTLLYDSAYRAIMITRLPDSALLSSKYGHQKGQDIFKSYGDIVENTYKSFQGREVYHTGDGYMISFANIGDALNCAVKIHEKFEVSGKGAEMELTVAIGISGGDPVTEKKDFFGEAIQLARRLCYLSTNRGDINISSDITERFGPNRLRNLNYSSKVKPLSISEEDFFLRLMNVVEKVWQQPDITLEKICKEIGISRSQLYRNITELTGMSFVDFLKEFRLNHALKLIKNDQMSITQVAYTTGFNNPSYFSKCFKERFDTLPSSIV